MCGRIIADAAAILVPILVKDVLLCWCLSVVVMVVVVVLSSSLAALGISVRSSLPLFSQALE
jgi:hypothetical protein